MEPAQRYALEEWLQDIVNSLEPICDVFITHLRLVKGLLSSAERDLVTASPIKKEQLRVLLLGIKETSNGWMTLINFLKEHDRCKLVVSMEQTARGFFEQYPFKSALEMFKKGLANYYIERYAYVPNRLQNQDVMHVNNFGVPLTRPSDAADVKIPGLSSNDTQTLVQFASQVINLFDTFGSTDFSESMDKKIEAYRKSEQGQRLPEVGPVTEFVQQVRAAEEIKEKLEESVIDYWYVIDSLLKTKRTDAAIVNGEAGIGKTTLVKKIAYDWASNSLNSASAAHPFDLVLAVPLRSVKPADDILELAINYFAQPVFGFFQDSDKDQLIREVKAKNMKVLVCLDGLDEVRILQGAHCATGSNPSLNFTQKTAQCQWRDCHTRF